jgi:hypothetical protein
MCMPPYVVPAGTVSAIRTFLRGRTFNTVHYVGHADEGLIKALIREERYTLSLMDYRDRHHRAAHFWDDEGSKGLSTPVVPDWLDGIPTYHGGSPAHEVLLQDIPWLPGQVESWSAPASRDPRKMQMTISSGGRSRPTLTPWPRVPTCIVLFGDAQPDTEHPGYAWQTIESIRIGLRKHRR